MRRPGRKGSQPARAKRRRCISTGRAMYPDRVSALLGASTVSQTRHTRRIHVNKCPHCGSWHVQRKESA